MVSNPGQWCACYTAALYILTLPSTARRAALRGGCNSVLPRARCCTYRLSWQWPDAKGSAKLRQCKHSKITRGTYQSVKPWDCPVLPLRIRFVYCLQMLRFTALHLHSTLPCSQVSSAHFLLPKLYRMTRLSRSKICPYKLAVSGGSGGDFDSTACSSDALCQAAAATQDSDFLPLLAVRALRCVVRRHAAQTRAG